MAITARAERRQFVLHRESKLAHELKIMSQKRGIFGTWLPIALLLASWLAMAAIFALAPTWFGLSGPWAAIWDELDLAPPPVTAFASEMWDLLIGRFSILTSMVTIGMIVGGILLLLYADKRTGLQWWLARMFVVLLPATGIVVTIFAIYVAPRRQLAQALDLERLPRYELFPTYSAAALNASNTIAERRRAIFAIHVMCILERVGVSPPADQRRDPAADATNMYLSILDREDVPLELRLFAADNLQHAFIEGRLAQYPKDASVDGEAARRRIAETFLAVVQDGGPKHYEGWRSSGYESGKWAESAFDDLSPNCEIVTRLAECLSSENDAVQAEAAGALVAIGSTDLDAVVLEKLEAISSDHNSRVREIVARALRNIRESTPPDPSSRPSMN